MSGTGVTWHPGGSRMGIDGQAVRRKGDGQIQIETDRGLRWADAHELRKAGGHDALNALFASLPFWPTRRFPTDPGPPRLGEQPSRGVPLFEGLGQ